MRRPASPVGQERGGAADAEEGAGEEEGGVGAAVVAARDVLVIHNQRGAVGHALRAGAAHSLTAYDTAKAAALTAGWQSGNASGCMVSLASASCLQQSVLQMLHDDSAATGAKEAVPEQARAPQTGA